MRGVIVNGAEVLSARLNRGYTQDELARLARVDVKTIRKAEQGKRLDLVPLTRLAYTLQTDVRLLIVPSDSDLGRQASWREVVLCWHRAFEAGDMESLLALYHEEAVLRLPGGPSIPFGGTFKGKSEIRKANEIAWSTVRHEPIRLDEMTILVSNDAVTLTGAKGIYMPTGELVRFPCLQVFTFAENLIFDHQVEYDTLEFVKRFQLSS